MRIDWIEIMNYNTASIFNGHSNVDYGDNFHHYYDQLDNYEVTYEGY